MLYIKNDFYDSTTNRIDHVCFWVWNIGFVFVMWIEKPKIYALKEIEIYEILNPAPRYTQVMWEPSMLKTKVFVCQTLDALKRVEILLDD